MAFVMWRELGRVRGHTHRPLPSSKLAGGITKGWCFGGSTAVTLSLRLTWDRCEGDGSGMASADGCRDAQVQRQGQMQCREYGNAYSAPRVEAVFTCSEDRTVAQVLAFSQGPMSASSSTSSTEVSDLHTPLPHNLSCWLPLLLEAGAGSCR